MQFRGIRIEEQEMFLRERCDYQTTVAIIPYLVESSYEIMKAETKIALREAIEDFFRSHNPSTLSDLANQSFKEMVADKIKKRVIDRRPSIVIKDIITFAELVGSEYLKYISAPS